ncbi:VirB4 family type IV secretion system protein [Acetobacterium wieringae]|uniref:VirB4 family type IV secretion system protein n=1 Tax=Acetobacterium wieringae TaxID=52694 RepID=UPI002B1FA049|nr:ATP-binding protein [Acetobacterium wieringae]MEA4805006.1 ATP-binding protein [Acetobacterium wieringae]
MRKHAVVEEKKRFKKSKKEKANDSSNDRKEKRLRGEKEEELSVNRALLNIIAPIGMSIKHNELVIGENVCKVYGVVKYPQTKGYGWLGRLNNIPGTVAAIQFNPIDNSSFLDTLNKSILQNRAKALSSKDPLTIKRSTRMAEDAENIMTQIDQNGEVVGEMAMTIMPMANEREAFKKLCQKVESTFVMEKCRIRVLPYLQKEGFKTLSPAYSKDKEVDQVLKAVMPLSTFVGGFPFASSGYNDQKGYLFGKDSTGGLVIVDPWKRGNDRTNSNFVIMGDTGQGKSATIKHLILMEYALGTRIIFIDPEREYKHLTEELGGDWINAGGDGKGRINPLQISPINNDMYDEGDDDESNDMGAMALHLKSLDVFFSLYFKDITDVQRAILKDEVIQLYHLFGITWETDVNTMKNEDFPILKDLYDLIVKKEKLFEDEDKFKERDVYNELGILLKDLAMGSDSFLWSGHTTLSSHGQCICLDTFDLNSSSDTIKCTQYFNLLNWAWQEMSRNRNERILLICDEAYLMIDDRVPQSLVFLRNAMKRARKYEAGIIVASHGVVDFLDPKIKLYGQALLDQPCFKIMLGTDGQNLKETSNLYNLTEAETEVLSSKMRGRALVMIGHDRLNINFTIPEYKFKYFGNKGGR